MFFKKIMGMILPVILGIAGTLLWQQYTQHSPAVYQGESGGSVVSVVTVSVVTYSSNGPPLSRILHHGIQTHNEVFPNVVSSLALSAPPVLTTDQGSGSTNSSVLLEQCIALLHAGAHRPQYPYPDHHHNCEGYHAFKGQGHFDFWHFLISWLRLVFILLLAINDRTIRYLQRENHRLAHRFSDLRRPSRHALTQIRLICLDLVLQPNQRHQRGTHTRVMGLQEEPHSRQMKLLPWHDCGSHGQMKLLEWHDLGRSAPCELGPLDSSNSPELHVTAITTNDAPSPWNTINTRDWDTISDDSTDAEPSSREDEKSLFDEEPEETEADIDVGIVTDAIGGLEIDATEIDAITEWVAGLHIPETCYQVRLPPTQPDVVYHSTRVDVQGLRQSVTCASSPLDPSLTEATVDMDIPMASAEVAQEEAPTNQVMDDIAMTEVEGQEAAVTPPSIETVMEDTPQQEGLATPPSVETAMEEAPEQEAVTTQPSVEDAMEEVDEQEEDHTKNLPAQDQPGLDRQNDTKVGASTNDEDDAFYDGLYSDEDEGKEAEGVVLRDQVDHQNHEADSVESVSDEDEDDSKENGPLVDGLPGLSPVVEGVKNKSKTGRMDSYDRLLARYPDRLPQVAPLAPTDYAAFPSPLAAFANHEEGSSKVATSGSDASLASGRKILIPKGQKPLEKAAPSVVPPYDPMAFRSRHAPTQQPLTTSSLPSITSPNGPAQILSQLSPHTMHLISQTPLPSSGPTSSPPSGSCGGSRSLSSLLSGATAGPSATPPYNPSTHLPSILARLGNPSPASTSGTSQTPTGLGQVTPTSRQATQQSTTGSDLASYLSVLSDPKNVNNSPRVVPQNIPKAPQL